MPNQQPQYGGGQGQGQYQPFPTSRQGGGNVPSPGNAQYYGPKGGNGNGAGRGYPPGMWDVYVLRAKEVWMTNGLRQKKEDILLPIYY